MEAVGSPTGRCSIGRFAVSDGLRLPHEPRHEHERLLVGAIALQFEATDLRVGELAVEILDDSTEFRTELVRRDQEPKVTAVQSGVDCGHSASISIPSPNCSRNTSST